MTYSEKQRAQKKYDFLADGYKETIDLLRQNIKKNEKQLEATALKKDKTAIQIKLCSLRQILRENIEIYNFLKNYYNLHPIKNTHINEKGLFDYTVNDILAAYRQGNFRLCDKLS